MVRKEDLVYLFIGEDILEDSGFSRKDTAFKRIKEKFATKGVEDFNLDILYAKELELRVLQEKLMFLPVKAKHRIVVVKNLQDLKEDLRQFITGYIKRPHPSIILVLDINIYNPRDEFVNILSRYARTVYFKEPLRLNTFTLTRQINLKRPLEALKVLNQLLQNGEKPEWILGGLRFAWTSDNINSLEKRRGLKLLLNCDIDIKTGRLRPNFALEKLVVGLCSLAPSQRFQ